MNPKISVVMPVYNGEKYLREAMESILRQTLADFEFIIINDGSTDDTEAIIKSYDDKRIVYIKNEGNLGLSKSFNIGIRAARGAYIARTDADDVSLPERFEKQLGFMEAQPNVSIVGSSAILMDEESRRRKTHWMPGRHAEIKWKSLFSIPLIHPTVFARAEILKENPYDENLSNSEDYELWSRLMFERNVVFANITEPLLLYRVAATSFTQSLDPNKLAASAPNTIRNIERYTLLSEDEKNLVIKSRQGRRRTFLELMKTFPMYRRAAREFERKESFKPSLGRYFLALAREFLRGALS
jgi:glycosyltransferase involved in cell wall biosynthesis